MICACIINPKCLPVQLVITADLDPLLLLHSTIFWYIIIYLILMPSYTSMGGGEHHWFIHVKETLYPVKGVSESRVFPLGLLHIYIHTYTGVACLCTLMGRQRTWRKPTLTWESVRKNHTDRTSCSGPNCGSCISELGTEYQVIRLIIKK